MSTPPSNLDLLLGLLFEADGGPVAVEVPYTLGGVGGGPPTRHSFRVTLEEAHVQEVLLAVRRAANQQALAAGEAAPFPDPLAFPDPDEELKRQARREVARLLADLADEDDAELRLRALREARAALATLKPSVSVRQVEWERIVSAVRKLNPALSEDEVLALFG